MGGCESAQASHKALSQKLLTPKCGPPDPLILPTRIYQLSAFLFRSRKHPVPSGQNSKMCMTSRQWKSRSNRGCWSHGSVNRVSAASSPWTEGLTCDGQSWVPITHTSPETKCLSHPSFQVCLGQLENRAVSVSEVLARNRWHSDLAIWAKSKRGVIYKDVGKVWETLKAQSRPPGPVTTGYTPYHRRPEGTIRGRGHQNQTESLVERTAPWELSSSGKSAIRGRPVEEVQTPLT